MSAVAAPPPSIISSTSRLSSSALSLSRPSRLFYANDMDTQWCLNCNRHVEDERQLYCSSTCSGAANLSSPTFHAAATCLHSQSPIPSSSSGPQDRILAWRSGVPTGLAPPAGPRSRSSSRSLRAPVVRIPSPTSSSSSTTPGRPRPKLMQLATSPVSPSVSLSLSPLQARDKPVPPSPPRNISLSPCHLSARHNNSRRSSMTCTTALTSDDSIATPITPAVAIPIEPALKDPHKHSLWKQLRPWVGPASPTPRRPHVYGIDSHFPAVGANRKHTALFLDEELLDACDSKSNLPPSGLARSDDDDDDESVQSSGLAGWFAQHAEKQREEKAFATSSTRAAQAIYANRGRKLCRAEATASYYALR
ncbi:hypothetical protein K488DRAFT_84722 [Vararia minispora EC-137]|uniref:Uncharacterized protein n=1 Tax=Vararia minispora EC-137 TaxID=1314806 RepID=A0ACB8QP97_9AGAM|nr:hypothetical protein K488DRAFT_84722 [Vararia minispora EC-137]